MNQSQQNTTKMEFKIFTPEEASRILEHYNNDNRRMKQKTVTMIAKDLSENRYSINGETIKFAADGTLLDGQNRLAACIRANVPLSSWVAIGVEKKVFDTIDVGMPRTGGDILYTQHEKNAPVLSGALTWLAMYEEGTLPNGIVPRNRLRSLLEIHPTIRESVSRIVDRDIAKHKLAPKTTLSFLHYMVLKVDHGKANEFFDRLEDGADLAKENPVLILRNRLLRNTADYRKLPPNDVFALCLKGWAAFFSERKVRGLLFNRKRERFPGIAGLDDLQEDQQESNSEESCITQ